MNRTLRRPMFRIGGSAEGITSGLSRQGYATNEDNLVKKNDFSKMKVSDLGNMNIGQLQDLSKSMSYKPRGTNIYDFMTEMGLDLVSRPKSGNIFQQVATSAKEPYQRFMERKQSADEQRYGSESDMFKTMMSGAFDVMSSKEEGKGKNWLEQWKFEQIPELNKTISSLTKKQDNGTITADEELDLQNAIDQKSRIIDIDPVTEAFLKTKDGGYMVTDEMTKLLEEDLKLPEEERKYKGKRDSQLIVDAIDNVKRRLGLAKGGRVGYQAGNSVMPGATQATSTGGYDTSGLQGYDTEGGFQPSNLQGFPAQGAEQVPEELQNIDYDTLRARLPSTITDDIVRLIATSAEAMEDFATIQTQQDINNFNEKYGVELVLPAEA